MNGIATEPRLCRSGLLDDRYHLCAEGAPSSTDACRRVYVTYRSLTLSYTSRRDGSLLREVSTCSLIECTYVMCDSKMGAPKLVWDARFQPCHDNFPKFLTAHVYKHCLASL
jgi:hypothetical protein